MKFLLPFLFVVVSSVALFGQDGPPVVMADIIQAANCYRLDSSDFNSSTHIDTLIKKNIRVYAKAFYLAPDATDGVLLVNPIYAPASVWLPLKLLNGEYSAVIAGRIKSTGSTVNLDSVFVILR